MELNREVIGGNGGVIFGFSGFDSSSAEKQYGLPSMQPIVYIILIKIPARGNSIKEISVDSCDPCSCEVLSWPYSNVA